MNLNRAAKPGFSVMRLLSTNHIIPLTHPAGAGLPLSAVAPVPAACPELVEGKQGSGEGGDLRRGSIIDPPLVQVSDLRRGDRRDRRTHFK